MVALYSDPESYTKQLRALENAVRATPNAPAPHFVLGYHYLTQGSHDPAVAQYQQVLALKPEDSLSAGLVRAFGPKDAAPLADPAPAAEAPAASAVASIPAPDPAAVAGTWTAKPKEGV